MATSNLKQRTKGTTEDVIKDYLCRQAEIKAYHNDPMLNAFVNDIAHLGVKGG